MTNAMQFYCDIANFKRKSRGIRKIRNNYIYRMAGAFYIVKNSGDITNNTLSSLSAVCYFHVTAIVWSGKFGLFEFSS